VLWHVHNICTPVILLTTGSLLIVPQEARGLYNRAFGKQHLVTPVLSAQQDVLNSFGYFYFTRSALTDTYKDPMKIEHFAFNVEDPRAMTDWYVEHLGLKIVKQEIEPPYLTFLADDSGRVMIEIYRNPPDQVPDYRNMDPLQIHLALVSRDAESDKKRLIEAGASLADEFRLEDGSHMVMLRDPWGFCIQLWQRATSLLADREEKAG